jgi:hypothetical protein
MSCDASQALRTEELLGWSSNTLWHDGVIGHAVRTAEAAPDCLQLLVMDGPVCRDAAEVLLPALDRRRRLQLASAEILPVPPGLNFVLEVCHVPFSCNWHRFAP